MKIIGLVGGVASGKSLAANMLVELGAVHLDADRTGHAVLAEDADVRQALMTGGVTPYWTPTVVSPRRRSPTSVPKSAAGAATANFSKTCSTANRQRLNIERDQAVAIGKPAIVLDAPRY